MCIRDRVFINEVELNPEGDDRLSTVEEWVELYNPNDFAVSLEGWELRTTHGVTVAVKLSGSIPARGFLVVEQGSSGWTTRARASCCTTASSWT